MEKREESLLDILAEERIHRGLENVLNDNKLYQAAQKEVDEAINELENVGLSRDQNKVVDKAISATNASGAAYGASAYKQGLYDGIKLMTEVNQIGRDSGILSGQEFDSEKAL
ncbi:MAG: hypothetical protein HDR06_15910 [Lachnospiraceae bacterium]|nr:hypothetical protein [Lachnospiraceae bacterium]